MCSFFSFSNRISVKNRTEKAVLTSSDTRIGITKLLVDVVDARISRYRPENLETNSSPEPSRKEGHTKSRQLLSSGDGLLYVRSWKAFLLCDVCVCVQERKGATTTATTNFVTQRHTTPHSQTDDKIVDGMKAIGNHRFHDPLMMTTNVISTNVMADSLNFLLATPL